MKSALVIWHGEEHSESPQDIDRWPEHQAWFAELQARGMFHGGAIAQWSRLKAGRPDELAAGH